MSKLTSNFFTVTPHSENDYMLALTSCYIPQLKNVQREIKAIQSTSAPIHYFQLQFRRERCVFPQENNVKFTKTLVHSVSELSLNSKVHVASVITNSYDCPTVAYCKKEQVYIYPSTWILT